MLNKRITKELYQTQKTFPDSEESSALALLPLLSYYSRATLSKKAWRHLECLENEWGHFSTEHHCPFYSVERQ